MTGTGRVSWREYRTYLTSPWVYGVATAFLLLTGLTFFVTADGTREATLRWWFPNLAFVLLVTLPVISSRTLAEERRTGHLDLLYAHPVDPAAVVVGKWAAVCGLFVTLLVPTLVYVGFLARWGHPDWPPLLTSYAGALFCILLFAAVGTLGSALTPTAVAAGLASFAVLVLLQMADSTTFARPLSFQAHLENFARGAPELSDFVYFVSGTFLCLVLAVFAQEAHRVITRLGGLVVPAALVAASVAVNFAVLPVNSAFDLTATGRYSLSGASRDVLRHLSTAVTITVFEGQNSGEAKDQRALLERYRREQPKIRYRMRDVERDRTEATELGVTDNGQAVVEVGARREVVDPAIELYLTGALQRLSRPHPQTLCSLTGHGERSLDEGGPAGFQTARIVLEANGFATRTIDLTASALIPPDCTVLGLLGPRVRLRQPEIDAVRAYLDHDGRLLVLWEPDGPDLDPLTSDFGLRLLPGIVVDPDRGVAGDPRAVLVNDFPTESPVAKNVPSAFVVTSGGVTTAASAQQGLSVAKVLQSSRASWLELNPAVAKYQPELGDRGGPVVIGGAADLSRVAPDAAGQPSIHRTRLVAMADADWASDAFVNELGNRQLLGNMANWLAGEEDVLAAGGENPDLRRLELTSHNRDVMASVSLGGLPGTACVIGVGLWLRRRGR
jgi:ABC-type transport system involved in cytochrome c biogenesis permease component